MKLIALFAPLVGLSAPLSAAIIISGDVSTDGAACTFTITTDIVNVITTTPSNSTVALVFDDWVVTDGERTQATLAPNLAYSVNGGPTLYLAALLSDNWGGADLGDITAGDGFFYVTLASTLAEGDVFTLKAGTYSFSGVSGMNPQIAQTFDGNFFITENYGVQIAAPTSVSIPEPSAAFIGALGTLALLRRRRA